LNSKRDAICDSSDMARQVHAKYVATPKLEK